MGNRFLLRDARGVYGRRARPLDVGSILLLLVVGVPDGESLKGPRLFPGPTSERRGTLDSRAARGYSWDMALSDRIVTTGLTFDDLLLLPGRSEILPASVD